MHVNQQQKELQCGSWDNMHNRSTQYLWTTSRNGSLTSRLRKGQSNSRSWVQLLKSSSNIQMSSRLWSVTSWRLQLRMSRIRMWGTGLTYIGGCFPLTLGKLRMLSSGTGLKPKIMTSWWIRSSSTIWWSIWVMPILCSKRNLISSSPSHWPN